MVGWAAIAAHRRRVADEGLLAIDDEDLAALALVALTAGSAVDAAVDGLDANDGIRSGVRVFLAAYAV